MNPESTAVRIILATDRIWRARQFADALTAIDGLASRFHGLCVVAGLLRQYNAHLSNLQVLGLTARGKPGNWGESPQGGEALARSDYFKVVTLLRQHGVLVKEDHIGWHLEFAFDDILEMVPYSQRLEVEFIEMRSPGFVSLIQAGLGAVRECKDALVHIFDSWMHPEETKRIKRAAARIAEESARYAQEKVAQERLKTRVMRANVRVFEKQLAPRKATVGPQLDYYQKFESIAVMLKEGGLDAKQVAKVFAPLDESISTLARMKCEGLIPGIAVDLIEAPPDEASTKKQDRESA